MTLPPSHGITVRPFSSTSCAIPERAHAKNAAQALPALTRHVVVKQAYRADFLASTILHACIVFRCGPSSPSEMQMGFDVRPDTPARRRSGEAGGRELAAPTRPRYQALALLRAAGQVDRRRLPLSCTVGKDYNDSAHGRHTTTTIY